MQPYESRFAAAFGAGYYAFSFWKARVALYAILKALNVNENEEIILPGYTCVVVANAVRSSGAKPVYADIVRGQYNLDPASVERRVTSYTRGLVVQHTYGIPADLNALQTLAKRHGLWLIEDCAHVLLGSCYQGRPLGSFGKAAFFSFQWSKPYTTGLGGMAVTRDKSLAKRLAAIQASFQDPPRLKEFQLQFQYKVYRRLFKPEFYWFSQKSLHILSRFGLFVGSSHYAELSGKQPVDIDWRMSAFQQRVGLGQIDALEENYDHRRLLTQCYSDMLRRYGWPNSVQLNSKDVTLLRFPVQVKNKNRLLEECRHHRIEMGNWFETPLHPLPLNKHQLVNYRLGSCPIAEATAENVINLPLHRGVTRTEGEKIVEFVLSNDSPATGMYEGGKLSS